MPFYVYVIRSLLTNKTYTGQTNNVCLRLTRHNQEVSTRKNSYTFKNKGPWVVIYQEMCKTRQDAIRRERELKSFKGREFIKNLGL